MLTTQTPPEKIYAQSSEKLETLLIKDNNKVKKGQVLGVIENTVNIWIFTV